MRGLVKTHSKNDMQTIKDQPTSIEKKKYTK